VFLFCNKTTILLKLIVFKSNKVEISIGHVKGKILPEFRNIYCASGVIHLVDTVLGIPTKSAYQQLSQIPELRFVILKLANIFLI
jgi:hypothetical protein